MTVIDIKDLSVRYKLGDFKDIGLKDYVIHKLQGQYHVKEFWALKNVSFKLKEGDLLGIVGTNGAGKSTLLKVLSGIMIPTKGRVSCNKNVTALLELGSGFDGDLTVVENAYLRGAMLGYTRKFMDDTIDQIIDFAELDEFRHRPFKQLSSGMKSRLAFSIASLVKPDVLILDEVLSVGDGSFKKKSEEKMNEIISSGATTILVSHSLDQIRRMCNKVLWLHKGEQMAFGDTQPICDAYSNFISGRSSLSLSSFEANYLGKRKYSLSDYRDEYEFANFRNVSVGDINEGIIYRSSSPFNNKHKRAFTVDKLAKKHDIKTIINMADSSDRIMKHLHNSTFKGYSEELYNEGHVVLLDMSFRFSSDMFKLKLNKAFKFMLTHSGPYMIHCTEGKDRTGFMMIIIECLMFSTLKEIEMDYFTSYANMFYMDVNSPHSQLVIKENVHDAILIHMSGNQYGKDIHQLNLHEVAYNYLLSIGLSRDEIESLMHLLSRQRHRGLHHE